MKSLVTSKNEKFFEILPNDKQFKTIETLPDMLPIFLRVNCSNKRSPASIDLLMDDVDAVQLILSNNHEFPTSTNCEKEKLYIRDPRISQQLKDEAEAEIAHLVAASGIDPSTAKKQLAERDKG